MKIPSITTAKIISLSEIQLTGSGQQKQETDEFQPGRLLRARVLENTTPEGRVLLEVAGRRISAKSLVKLLSGDQVWLEVKQGGADPLLSVSPRKGAVQHFLQTLFTNPQRPTNPIEQLLPLFNQLSAGTGDSGNSFLSRIMVSLASSFQGSKADPEAIKLMALLHSGLISSTDIKGQQPILQQLESLLNREGLSPSLRKLLTEGIDLLDRHQQINASPQVRDDSPFLLFPCFFKKEEGWGEWMFTKTPQAGSGEDSFELNFFLDLSGLGPLSLHISCTGQELHGRFNLSDQQIVDYLKTRTPELKQLLQNQGYQTVSFQCVLSRKKVLIELKESLVRQAGLHRFSLIDITT
ncbi:MAG: flagellar hook-length control protein FliK [Desulfurivibrionaceae bacterium]